MGEPSRILTIDDEEMVRKMFVAVLRHAGHEALEAENGAEGLEVIRREHPEVVLCDLRMPQMDGLQLLSVVQTEFPDLPVIVVTAAGSMGDAVEALKRGAWDFLQKPISDIALLTAAVDRAIERARLLRQNREHQQHLEHLNGKLAGALKQLREDQEAGKRIQFQLLPPDDQVFGDYTFTRRLFPSIYLSGDFIDYFPIDERRAGFYLADVSGHGAASAFVTVMIRTLVRQYRQAYLHEGDPAILIPDRVLGRIDRELQQRPLEKHVTMFYGVLDHEEHSLTFSCGGQYPYPLLAAGGKVEVLERPGHAMGLFPEARFESETLSLPQGARLLLVSDGVLEVLPEEVHEGRSVLLQAAISRPETTADALIRAFGLAQPVELRDDACLLLIQRGQHA
ncbi:MAG: fused response regulator/phosphatase [Deltaproteobacteria bacterium]|nr:fused response regulator/phosphatase [Deltaproteobacteria bacterium]